MNKSCEEAFEEWAYRTDFLNHPIGDDYPLCVWKACWGLREKEISLLCDELKEKDHKIAMLLECVEFYADLKLYYVQDDGFTKADNDNGDKSRECLKQIKETK